MFVACVVCCMYADTIVCQTSTHSREELKCLLLLLLLCCCVVSSGEIVTGQERHDSSSLPLAIKEKDVEYQVQYTHNRSSIAYALFIQTDFIGGAGVST